MTEFHKLWLHGDTAKYKPPKGDRARRGEGQYVPKVHLDHEGKPLCKRGGFYIQKTTDKSKADCVTCRRIFEKWGGP